MLYATLSDFYELPGKGINRGVKIPAQIEAYARHAFTLAGAMQPLDPRPEFDSLFLCTRQEVLIEIGRNILKHLLPYGVLLGESGELKDKIGTPHQFKRDILYFCSWGEAEKESKRPPDGLMSATLTICARLPSLPWRNQKRFVIEIPLDATTIIITGSNRK